METLHLRTIGDTAHILGVKPWDVVRLIEARQLKTVELVDLDSLTTYQQENGR